MSQIRVAAVLFDMDGTLVDSTAVVEEVWREFAAANGVAAANVIGFAHGRPSRDTISRFAAEPARVDEWNRWVEAAEAGRFTEVTAIPGAVEVVRSLASGRWAVVTSALRGPARQRLMRNGFPEPDVLIGADDVKRGKPDPEGYRRAALELGFEPADCVVFEDTLAGIEAARRAGASVVAVGDVAAKGLVARIHDFTDVKVIPAGDGEVDLIFP